VLPGSHLQPLPHVEVPGEENVLTQGVAPGAMRQWLRSDGDTGGSHRAVETLRLRAGEISIHDCRIAHGSPANTSSHRLRVGINMTFSATDVTGDGRTHDTATFGGNWEIYMCRGVDRYGHNPYGAVPIGEDVPR
jgi:ectoine hydroxylase-related dioxygenase (phytanoyl-CoA dioxygenase family)